MTASPGWKVGQTGGPSPRYRCGPLAGQHAEPAQLVRDLPAQVLLVAVQRLPDRPPPVQPGDRPVEERLQLPLQAALLFRGRQVRFRGRVVADELQEFGVRLLGLVLLGQHDSPAQAGQDDELLAVAGKFLPNRPEGADPPNRFRVEEPQGLVQPPFLDVQFRQLQQVIDHPVRLPAVVGDVPLQLLFADLARGRVDVGQGVVRVDRRGRRGARPVDRRPGPGRGQGQRADEGVPPAPPRAGWVSTCVGPTVGTLVELVPRAGANAVAAPGGTPAGPRPSLNRARSPRISRADWYRSSGRFAIILWTMAHSSGGRSGRSDPSGRAVPWTCCRATSNAVAAAERRLPAEHVVTGDPERVDVRPRVHRLAADLFRGHVQRGAHRHPALGQIEWDVRREAPGQAEVGDLHLAPSWKGGCSPA